MDTTIVNSVDSKELEAMGFCKNEEEFKQLLLDARDADEADQLLTFRQAFRRYKVGAKAGMNHRCGDCLS